MNLNLKVPGVFKYWKVSILKQLSLTNEPRDMPYDSAQQN